MAGDGATSTGAAGAASGSGTATEKLASFRYLLSGAGSRKTTRLCGRALAYLVHPRAGAVPEDVLLTTFSREAADQLLDRLRLKILRAPGRLWYQKQTLLDGLDRATINTNHAVGLRAFRDHWIELQSPPAVQVIQDATRKELIFEAMAAAPFSATQRQELERVAARLGRSDGQYRSEHNSKETVSADVLLLVDMKERAGLDEAGFVAACLKSIDALLQELERQRVAGGVTSSMRAVEAAARTVQPALRTDLPYYGATGITFKASAAIDDFLNEPAWSSVKKLAEVNADKKSNRPGEPAPHDRLEQLRAAAASFFFFSDFQDDLRRYVELVAMLAGASHATYRDLLRQSGRIDFMAMERALADLMKLPGPWNEFCSGFGFVGIDEAQDMTREWTDIFGAVTERVRCGLWIADPNQSIHNFRGADHSAVDQAAKRLCHAIAGGREIRNDENFRSMPGIVAFVNHFFDEMRAKPAAPAAQLPADHRQRSPTAMKTIAKTAVGDEDTTGEPPLTGRVERWQLGASNQEQCAAAIAREVRRLVDSGYEPREICVMARTNTVTAKLAAALKAVELEVAVHSADLFARRETQVLVAALQLLVYPRNALAEATLRMLLGDDDPARATPDSNVLEWLTERLRYECTAKAAKQADDAAATADAALAAADAAMPAQGGVPCWLDAIRSAAASELVLTPISSVLLVIEATGLVSRVACWEEPALRQSHVDALISMARGFEEASAAAARPATVAAFAAWCAERGNRALRSGRAAMDDEAIDDRPIPADAPGVRVMTYHATKGLGFAVTILADLGLSTRIDNPFEIRLLNDDPHVWPNPFGNPKSMHSALNTVATSLPAGRQRADERLQSIVQLLYVSMTRAKGLLVFAHGTKASDTAWFTRILGDLLVPKATKKTAAKKTAAKKGSRGKAKAEDSPKEDGDAGEASVAACSNGTSPVAVSAAAVGVQPESKMDLFLPQDPAVKAIPVVGAAGGVTASVGGLLAAYEYRDFRVTAVTTATSGPAASSGESDATDNDVQPASEPAETPSTGPAAAAAGLPAGAANPPTMVDVIGGATIRSLSDIAYGPRYQSPSGNLQPVGTWRVDPSRIDLSGSDLVTGGLRRDSHHIAAALGDAFHAFMAAVPSLRLSPDASKSAHDLWHGVAQRCLEGHLEAADRKAIATAGVDAGAMVKKAVDFAEWVRAEHGVGPEAWIVEAPLAGPASVSAAIRGAAHPSMATTWRGRTDLVFTAAAGSLAGRRVLIDHKAVLTDRKGCVTKTEEEFLGEVSAYADAFGPTAPAAIYVHFVLAGSLVRIQPV